jgi:hypothetical protein
MRRWVRFLKVPKIVAFYFARSSFLSSAFIPRPLHSIYIHCFRPAPSSSLHPVLSSCSHSFCSFLYVCVASVAAFLAIHSFIRSRVNASFSASRDFLSQEITATALANRTHGVTEMKAGRRALYYALAPCKP